MTELEAAKIVAVLVTAFPGHFGRLDQLQQAETRALYRRMLLDLDAKAAEAAVMRLISTSRFWPSVAEIRDATLTVTAGHKRTGLEAWRDVVAKIGSHGRDKVPGVDFVFDDALVHRCVMSLGWRVLCDSENEIADRAHFVRMYESIAATSRADDAVPGAPRRVALPASSETAQTNLPTPEPMAFDEFRTLVANALTALAKGGAR